MLFIFYNEFALEARFFIQAAPGVFWKSYIACTRQIFYNQIGRGAP